MKYGMSLALSAMALLPACAMDGEPEVAMDNGPGVGEAAGDEPASLGVSTQEVAVLGGEFSWSQGQARMAMGSSADRFCFLTTISGRFKGAGEAVRVFVEDGQWLIEGSSGQTGVNAKARCVPLSWQGRTLSVSSAFQWNQDDPRAVALGSDADRACFLTSLSGHFQGAGEFVEVRRSNGQWLLDGGSHQLGIEAIVHCLINVQPTGPFSWSQGTAGVVMAPVATSACGLTAMTGRFEGAGERVSVEAVAGDWRIQGSSNQNAVAGSAVCAL